MSRSSEFSEASEAMALWVYSYDIESQLRHPYELAALFYKECKRGIVRAPLSAGSTTSPSGVALAKQSNCLTCHAVDKKIVGPSFREVAARYAGKVNAVSMLTGRVKSGSQGVWGAVPMPSHTMVKNDDIEFIVKWILAGAR